MLYLSSIYIIEVNNISKVQICQGTQQNSDQITSYYLIDLLHQFIRGIANFKSNYTLNYFIPHEIVRLLVSLRQCVQLQLNHQHKAHLDLLGTSQAIKPNLIASGFLKLLKKLQDVFLQDSMFVQRSYLYHLIFQDTLFATAKYTSFAIAVTVSTIRGQQEGITIQQSKRHRGVAVGSCRRLRVYC